MRDNLSPTIPPPSGKDCRTNRLDSVGHNLGPCLEFCVFPPIERFKTTIFKTRPLEDLQFAYAAALPLQTEAFTDAVFSQVANVPGFFTGLAFFVPGGQDAEITIEVYSEDGRLTGMARESLPAGRRLDRTLAALVPESAGQARGYVRIRSSEPLIAQQLFGDNGLNLMSAVPPKIVR